MLYMAYATRNSGRPLNQRILEGRVGAQATLLAGLIGLGVYRYYQNQQHKEKQGK